MEEAVDVLYGVSGHTYDMVYDLFFTPHRLIVIRVHSPQDVSWSVSPWFFLFGSWMERNREKNQRLKRLQDIRLQEKTLALDELVKASPGSFIILYTDVSSVQISSSFFQYQMKLQLLSEASKKRMMAFTLPNEQVKTAREIINKVFSTKLKK
ncbi:MAG TPA: hypothetical protein VLH15_03505 [Dehalococcoidales bacterium]|nr:hypothetical protein [Dehalococcoidales bacterium]